MPSHTPIMASYNERSIFAPRPPNRHPQKDRRNRNQKRRTRRLCVWAGALATLALLSLGIAQAHTAFEEAAKWFEPGKVGQTRTGIVSTK